MSNKKLISRRNFVVGGLACAGAGFLASHNLLFNSSNKADAKTFFAGPDGCNGNNWMSYIGDDVLLSDINIPGTHDSGARDLDWTLAGHWKTQDCTIDEQLALGCRLFDIRLCYEPHTDGNLCLCHAKGKAYYSKRVWLSFTGHVLASFKRHLENNPGETIIIAPRHEHREASDYGKQMNDWWAAAQREKNSKGQKIYYYENRMPKLGEVRGKIVLLNRGGDFTRSWEYASNNLGYKVTLDSKGEWSNDFILENHWNVSDTKKWEYLKGFFENRHQPLRIAYTSSNKFANSPEAVAKYVNPRLRDQIFTNRQKYGWFFMDFVSSGNEKRHFNPEYIWSTNIFGKRKI